MIIFATFTKIIGLQQTAVNFDIAILLNDESTGNMLGKLSYKIVYHGQT